jgi:NAD(P)-dependent dehydrogenase (short-subunit alcohol dehydrogenase family)
MDKEKTALITGANRGIGLAVARALASKRYRVFLGVRNRDAGQKVLAAMKKPDLRMSILPLDVMDMSSIQNAAKVLGHETDHLDVLVNNAGILIDEDLPITQTKPDTLRRTLETNTLGPLFVTQVFLPLLQRSQAPRVINVSSRSGSLADMTTYAPAYSISKAALNAVTRQLAGALPGVSVNSVCPGWVKTDMGGAGASRSLEEGADTIVWLATDAPAKITGQFLRDRKPTPW